MRGNTKLTISKATMLEAIQEYFDARAGEKMPKQRVTDCKMNSDRGFGNDGFEVTLEEIQDPTP